MLPLVRLNSFCFLVVFLLNFRLCLLQTFRFRLLAPAFRLHLQVSYSVHNSAYRLTPTIFYLISQLNRIHFLKILTVFTLQELNCTDLIIQGICNFSIYFFYLVQELFRKRILNQVSSRQLIGMNPKNWTPFYLKSQPDHRIYF